MITQLLQWLGLAAQPAQLDPLSRFLDGESIPSISAAAGQGIIQRQREIESALRQYILALEAQIAELQARS